MKNLLFVIVIVFYTSGIHSQNKKDTIDAKASNNIYLNLAGDGNFLSINYEHLFHINDFMIMTGRIGLGFNYSFELTNTPAEKYIGFPHHATFLFGKNWQFFELGLGGNYMSGENENYYFIFPVIGYRMQPIINSKYIFRPYLAFPFYSVNTKELNPNPEFLYVFIGISLGINF